MARREGYRWRRGGWRPTPRQRKVLDLLVEGRTNAEIADRLGISFAGAKWHVGELLAETGCEDRRALAAWWSKRPERRNGLALVLGWRPGLAGLTFVATMVLLVLAVTSIIGSHGGGTDDGVNGTNSARFPDISLESEAYVTPTAMPTTECPATSGDLRTVDAAELRGEGLISLGNSFTVAGCPILVANRDDRAFVRVPLTTAVTVNGSEWPWISTPWRTDEKRVSLSGEAITIRGSHNMSYEGPGMEIVLQAWDGDGLAVRLAVDSEGGLWATGGPSPPGAVFEHWTGDLVDTSKAQVVGRLLAGDRPSPEEWAKPVFYFTSCFESLCQVSLRPGEPLKAPADGVVRCITGAGVDRAPNELPVGEIELDTGDYRLTFVELYTSAPNSEVDKSCPTREVLQGDIIGTHYHYAIQGFALDGSPLSVAVSQDGILYIGRFGLRSACPCLTGH